jgi:hypothetical protein
LWDSARAATKFGKFRDDWEVRFCWLANRQQSRIEALAFVRRRHPVIFKIMDVSTTSMPALPPANLYTGTIEDELVILTNSEIRVAEKATRADTLETADGPVNVRPGDFIISMSSGERFPIKADIYFGTYEVLSQVGSWYVGRRLLHPRRAWPISSNGAELDYGVGRGRVSAARGSWIYQSDDDDFGLINADVKDKSYAAVARAVELQGADWAQRLRRLSLALALLPPVLTALAMAALYLSKRQPDLAHALLAAEATLLVAGAITVWIMRRDKWSLRAAVTSGLDTARQFQVAVQALGLTPSSAFPTMALWRAAQRDEQGCENLAPEHLRAVKNLIDDTHAEILSDLKRHHILEKRADRLSWLAAGAILVCLCLVAFTPHLETFKLISIWLPSMVGVAHGWTWQRQSMRRASAAAEMLRELRFVKTKLVSLAPDDTIVDGDPSRNLEIVATVRMLCRVIAQHTQRELQFTAAERVGVPV